MKSKHLATIQQKPHDPNLSRFATIHVSQIDDDDRRHIMT